MKTIKSLQLPHIGLGLLLAVLVMISIAACSYAPANVKTLVSSDCGKTWQVIPAGQSVPRQTLPCEYKTTIPDYPMQGDAEFKASFVKGVLVTIKTSYDYEIVDGVKFISEAKYLGRANGSSEISGGTGGAYETAENQVIDKRIREATTTLLLTEDIVDFQAAKFEDNLLIAVNKDLEARGVRLNSMTFIVVPEEQTRMAIDAAVAMKVYRNAGLEELGQKALVARAGAPKITIEGDQAPRTEK